MSVTSRYEKHYKRHVQLHEMSKEQTNQLRSLIVLLRLNNAILGDSNFWVCQRNSKAGGTKQRKAIEHYFHVALFIVLHKVVLTFESVE